jgi:hypothetical protein
MSRPTKNQQAIAIVDKAIVGMLAEREEHVRSSNHLRLTAQSQMVCDAAITLATASGHLNTAAGIGFALLHLQKARDQIATLR